jgi:hypothetical protein
MEGKRDERNYVHGVFGRREKKKKGDIKTQTNTCTWIN